MDFSTVPQNIRSGAVYRNFWLSIHTRHKFQQNTGGPELCIAWGHLLNVEETFFRHSAMRFSDFYMFGRYFFRGKNTFWNYFFVVCKKSNNNK